MVWIENRGWQIARSALTNWKADRLSALASLFETLRLRVTRYVPISARICWCFVICLPFHLSAGVVLAEGWGAEGHPTLRATGGVGRGAEDS